MYDQIIIPGTGMPILAAIDVGMNGAIVRNGPSGALEAHKMPADATGGVDLPRCGEILSGADCVILERQSSGGFHGHTRTSDNSAFAQYKELYGFLTGAQIPFYCIRPQAWQKFLGFPTAKSVGKDVWKDFLHAQAIQRFPGQKKLPKYAADSYLLYEVLRQLWAMDRSKWP